MDAINILIIVVLVILSGLFSGLTLGILGLDKTDLERKIKTGNKDAKKVYPIRKNGNLLLCTLLLGNVLVNSILAVFLGNAFSGIVAVVASTGLIVIFGEILPQASVSRHALFVGARTVWLVHIFRIVLFPVAYPISKVLDWILGEEMPTIWSRRELEEIIKIHEDSAHSNIDADEERIILGALNYSNKKISEIMTPKTVAFMLEDKEILDQRLLNKIREEGYTRVPVYKNEKDKIVGILYTKDLIGFRKKCKVVTASRKDILLNVHPEDTLDNLLNKFIRKKIHLAFVFDDFGTLHGIVSLEDVLEEILQKEILDEEDAHADLRKFAEKKKIF